MISIKELAEYGNVTVRTLRYYDEIGLLQSTNYKGKTRMYDEIAIKQLQEIQTWKSLGLSLQQIIDLLNNPNYHQFISLLENKKAELISKKEVLFQQQILLDDLLYHIEHNQKWNPLDYSSLLSIKDEVHKYSLKDHLFSLFRTMTVFKSIILCFYFMDLIVIVSLLLFLVEIIFNIDL